MKLDFPDTCGKYGKRSAKARQGMYRIEGELVTMPQIAERSGRTLVQAQSRMVHLRRTLPGAITWKDLEK